MLMGASNTVLLCMFHCLYRIIVNKMLLRSLLISVTFVLQDLPTFHYTTLAKGDDSSQLSIQLDLERNRNEYWEYSRCFTIIFSSHCYTNNRHYLIALLRVPFLCMQVTRSLGYCLPVLKYLNTKTSVWEITHL